MRKKLLKRLYGIINNNNFGYMKSFLLGILILGLSVNLQAQVEIDSIQLYSNLKPRGMTTAGVHSDFMVLEKKSWPHKSISDQEISKINTIIARAREKKHFQSKLGILGLFGYIYSSGKPYKVFLTGDMIYVLDLKKNYFILNMEDQEWLRDFVQRHIGEKYIEYE